MTEDQPATENDDKPRTLADAMIKGAVEGRFAPVRIIRMGGPGEPPVQHFDAKPGGVVARPDLDAPKPRTRERLEQAWSNRSERPLAVGTYSVSMLAKLSAGEYARRLISKEPSDFPAYLGWSGNKMGEALLDEAGIPKEAREFNLYFLVGDVALSGHPDGIDFDDEAKTVTGVECKRFTFPTPKTIEEATRQDLCYLAMFRTALIVARGRGDAMHAFTYPPWSPNHPGSVTFPTGLADYRFVAQVLVAGAFEPEIHDVSASPELLTEVLQEFYAKAQAIHASALAGTTDAADAWDRQHAKERPVEDWANPPPEVDEAMKGLADAKFAADAAEAQEETARKKARDALRAANLTKSVAHGISASWVQTKTTDQEAVDAFLQAQGKKVADFEVERVVPELIVPEHVERTLDAAAFEAFLALKGKPMDEFKTKVLSEKFTVRSAGRKSR